MRQHKGDVRRTTESSPPRTHVSRKKPNRTQTNIGVCPLLQDWEIEIVGRMFGPMQKEACELVLDQNVLAAYVKWDCRDNSRKDGHLYKLKAERTRDDTDLRVWAMKHNIKEGYVSIGQPTYATTSCRKSLRTCVISQDPLWTGIFPQPVADALSRTEEYMSVLHQQRETYVRNVLAKQRAICEKKPRLFIKEIERACRVSKGDMQSIDVLLPYPTRKVLAGKDKVANRVASGYNNTCVRWVKHQRQSVICQHFHTLRLDRELLCTGAVAGIPGLGILCAFLESVYADEQVRSIDPHYQDCLGEFFSTYDFHCDNGAAESGCLDETLSRTLIVCFDSGNVNLEIAGYEPVFSSCQ